MATKFASTADPALSIERRVNFTEITARAKVNRHEPEIVRYIIDSGRYYYVSSTRTGIDGKISRHKTLDVAKRRALAIVEAQFRADQREAKKRATLYG